MFAYTRFLHIKANFKCVILFKNGFHDILGNVFLQCMTSNVCRIKRSCTTTPTSQNFDGANHNITMWNHGTVHAHVHSHNPIMTSSMEGHINMSKSSFRVHVRGLSSVHVGLRSGFSSTIVVRSYIAIALDHSSFLVVSSQVAQQEWTFAHSIGRSLAVIVYAHGKHCFSTFWNAMLPHWGPTQDKSYVLLWLGQKSIHMSGSHSQSTITCHVPWLFFLWSFVAIRPSSRSPSKALGAPQSMVSCTCPHFFPSHIFFLVWLVQTSWKGIWSLTKMKVCSWALLHAKWSGWDFGS